MKTAALTPAPANAGHLLVSGIGPSFSKGPALATSIVLKTTTDAKRQHAAISKLIKMCKASSVVTRASLGITAEVRRDRDRGGE